MKIVRQKQVTAFIGPSGCGKSTLLRCFNRLNDLDRRRLHLEGDILLRERETSIYDPETSTSTLLRKRMGMVFQKSNPFPKSIYENVAYGPPHPRDPRKLGPRRGRSSAASAAQRYGTRSRTA